MNASYRIKFHSSGKYKESQFGQTDLTAFKQRDIFYRQRYSLNNVLSLKLTVLLIANSTVMVILIVSFCTIMNVCVN